mmetsp:Transcript_41461/g.47824  ORF Transcript_41461/g.47824 Transcript_41461/m.47824 type:complete len:131 (-) Transcript_41461:120-512(-)
MGFGLYLFTEIVVSQQGVFGKFQAILRTLPIWVCVASLWLLDANDEFTAKNATLLIFGIGLCFTLITTKVIISTMAKMSFTFLQLETFIFIPYLYTQCTYSGADKFQKEGYVFVASFLAAAVLYFIFVRT